MICSHGVDVGVFNVVPVNQWNWLSLPLPNMVSIKQPAAQRFTVKCDVLAKLIEEVHWGG